MQEVEKPQPSRLAFAGMVSIKRKMFWSERYVRVRDQKLSYFQSKSDTTPRATLHLAGAVLALHVNGRDDLVSLSFNSKSVLSLFIKIENRSLRSKFISCLQENIKGATADEENSSELEDADPLDLHLPDLPPMYQYVFEDKYVTVQAEHGYVRRELYRKREAATLSDRVKLVIGEGFLGAVGLLLSLNPFLVVSVLSLLALLALFRSTHRRQTKVKQSMSLRESIPDIGYVLKHKRKELLKNPHGQIQYRQSQFKGDSRVFIVETEREHLKYLWEISGFNNQSVVTVYYDTNAPEIVLKKLAFVVASLRIEEALKGLKVTAEFKKAQDSPSKEDMARKPSERVNRESVVSTSPQRKPERDPSVALSVSDRPLDKSAPAKFYTVEQFLKQYPQTPRYLFEQLVVSRERFLQHLSFAWPQGQMKNGCNTSIREHNGNYASRGETFIKGGNPEQIMEYILDIEKRGEYDGQYHSGRIVKDYGILGVVHQRFNGIFPVKGRDFVVLLCGEKIENGYVIHGKSVPYDYPNDGKCVRGTAISAGFEVKQVEPGLVRVIYISEADLSGDLPKLVKTTAAKLQLGVIQKFREVVQKKFQ